jgi:hypothetical protein
MSTLININSGLKQIDEYKSLIDKYELHSVMDNLARVENVLESLYVDELTGDQYIAVEDALELIGNVVSKLEEE